MKNSHAIGLLFLGLLLFSFTIIDIGTSENPVAFSIFDWVSDHLILSLFAASEALPFFSKKTKGITHGAMRLLSKAFSSSKYKSKSFLL